MMKNLPKKFTEFSYFWYTKSWHNLLSRK